MYDAPKDKIILDTGHQAYAHKVLTGRFSYLKTIRKYKGLSGFLKRSESEYDVFGAGHASTSISAGLGIASSRDLNNENFKVVSVIGDGALTGGLAYEALNNAGNARKQLLVILNDNQMSISPNVGAMRNYLMKISTNKYYNYMTENNLGPKTKATAIQIGKPANIAKGLRALELTNGCVIQVSDKEMLDGMSVVGLNGFDCEMASGATVAGIKKLVDEEIMKKDDTVVGILTGRQKEPLLPIDYHNNPDNKFAKPPRN